MWYVKKTDGITNGYKKPCNWWRKVHTSFVWDENEDEMRRWKWWYGWSCGGAGGWAVILTPSWQRARLAGHACQHRREGGFGRGEVPFRASTETIQCPPLWIANTNADDSRCTHPLWFRSGHFTSAITATQRAVKKLFSSNHSPRIISGQMYIFWFEILVTLHQHTEHC